MENIRQIGLKKPITVTERGGEDGQPKYLLVCGEGRLNAFRILGKSHIPVLVVNVSDEDAFIMSLAENIARRGHRTLEILTDIEVLRKRGYDAENIIQKTGLSSKYVRDIIFLLDKGEERLIKGAQLGSIPLTTAVEIARAKSGDENLGDMLQEAYEKGQLKGKQNASSKNAKSTGRPRLTPNASNHQPQATAWCGLIKGKWIANAKWCSKLNTPINSYSWWWKA